MQDNNRLSLRVRRITYEAIGINSYELVDPNGADLPAFTAGSHIDVHLPSGMVRQYSLSNDPAERHRYVIAVLRETNGKGGSRAMHDMVHVPDLLSVSLPRNHFALAPAAQKHLLLGGGIGITPLKAMAHDLAARGADFELHYCAKEPAYLAFADEFAAWQAAGRARLHFDGGNPQNGLNIAALLADAAAGTHVYYCGPKGFMKACADATAHWPKDHVHAEHFSAPAGDGAASASAVSDGSFTVQIASSGATLNVPADRSLVDILHEAGLNVDTSCVSGLCGSCKVGYLSGDVDHRDYILTDDERLTHLTTCVSRSRGPLLVLDL